MSFAFSYYSTLKKHITYLLVCLFIGLNTQDVFAKGNYHVEAIIFEHANSAHSSSSPVIKRAPSYANTWFMNNGELRSSARKLKASPYYNIVTHTSWGQRSASYSKSAAKSFNQNGLTGFVKVFAKQLLLTEIELSYNGHLIKQRRRLKLDETHYFDNAGFGVLLRVSRAEQN